MASILQHHTYKIFFTNYTLPHQITIRSYLSDNATIKNSIKLSFPLTFIFHSRFTVSLVVSQLTVSYWNRRGPFPLVLYTGRKKILIETDKDERWKEQSTEENELRNILSSSSEPCLLLGTSHHLDHYSTGPLNVK